MTPTSGPLEQGGNAMPAADAQRLQRITALSALQFVAWSP